MPTTDQNGTIAELAIAHAAAELGVGVFKPLTDGERYDLIFDFRPQLMRVQLSPSRNNQRLGVNCRGLRARR